MVKRAVVASVGFCFIAAASAAAFLLSVGLQHNPQSEFYDSELDRYDWSYIVTFYLTSFGVLFSMVIPITIVAAGIAFLMLQRSASRD